MGRVDCVSSDIPEEGGQVGPVAGPPILLNGVNPLTVNIFQRLLKSPYLPLPHVTSFPGTLQSLECFC